MGDGKKLKETAKRHGVNIKQLSRMTGINPSTLYSIVQKDSMIRFDYGLKIAQVLCEDVNNICSSKPFDGKLTEEDVFTAIGDLSDAMDANRMKVYLLDKAFPLFNLFGSSDMPMVDVVLRSYYQLTDKARKEMVEYMQIALKYHNVPERVKEIKQLRDW